MFKAIRKRLHLTPSTVIASLALVFAMTGGAYAAGKYVITSTKQISPKVLKSLTGKPGAAGKPGANGAAGPAGATGATGATGPAGVGTTGKEGAAGKEGPVGKEGPPGKTGFTKTLPKGDTEKGTWSAETPEGSSQPGISSISFSIPLEGPLDSSHVFFVEPGTSVAQCPGSASAPVAEEGDLCVFASFTQLDPWVNGVIHAPGNESLNITETGAGESGALVFLQPEGTNGGFAVGSWAVTAG